MPVFIALGLVLAAIALYSLTRSSSSTSVSKEPTVSMPSKNAVLALWDKADWQGVIDACSAALVKNSLDPFYLGMRGVASFYSAMNLPEGGQRSSLIDAAIVSIRKALATQEFRDIGKLPRGELEYVLAKAYFHKGADTRDLAASYMEAASTHGFAAQDQHEYLAMSYASLGEVAKSLAEFDKAMTTNPSAFLRIAAAEEYSAAGKAPDAERLLGEAVASTKDAIAREKARLLLAADYFSQSRWDDSQTQIDAILAENPDSAEAHYRLGLLYQVRGDPVHARAEWRKAVALDPMHAASRQKLAERL